MAGAIVLRTVGAEIRGIGVGASGDFVYIANTVSVEIKAAPITEEARDRKLTVRLRLGGLRVVVTSHWIHAARHFKCVADAIPVRIVQAVAITVVSDGGEDAGSIVLKGSRVIVARLWVVAAQYF